MTDQGSEANTRKKLTPEEMEQVVGGTDYSYAYNIIGEIRVKFKTLIDSGVSPEDARILVKEEYETQVLDICAMYPDQCGPEKQAEIIFMFTIGS